MKVDVQVVALGARTSVGLRAEASAAAVRARINRIAAHPLFVDTGGEPLYCARDGMLAPDLVGAPRMIELATAAVNEVVEKLVEKGTTSRVLRLLLALPDPRPGFGSSEAEAVLRALSKAPVPGGARLEIEPVRGGHTGGVRALELAMQRISQGHDDVYIVGGVDSYFDINTLAWLDDGRRLARGGVRSGFAPGEGAGMMALMSRRSRAQFRVPALANIVSVAVTRPGLGETGLPGSAQVPDQP